MMKYKKRKETFKAYYFTYGIIFKAKGSEKNWARSTGLSTILVPGAVVIKLVFSYDLALLMTSSSFMDMDLLSSIG